MVLVPFTGIDNHNRSVTFGAGLLAKETNVSYVWLLETFKRAFGREPSIIVTDQDPAMKQAIAEVFPRSRHRLCMWHIMQKLTPKVGPVLSSDDSFKRRLCDIVWNDQISVDEFESKWAGVINDFNLQNNKWLSDMYDIRYDWIPAFFSDEPLSGLMRTASRSESVNHFFGSLTGSNLTLVEFLSHFDSAMDAQRYNHEKNDHESRYTVPDMKTELEIEVEASLLFTRTLFFDVQEEIHSALVSCFSVNMSDHDGITKCFVCDFPKRAVRITCHGDNLYEVKFNQVEGIFSCSCKRYECYGLLCRHIFLVLRMMRVNQFPRNYVHKRWAKDAIPPRRDNFLSQPLNSTSFGIDVDAVVRGVYSCVEFCINKLVKNFEQLKIFHDKQKDLMGEVDVSVTGNGGANKSQMLSSMLGVSVPVEVNIHVPKGIRNKGSGSTKRLKSKAELAREDNEKPLRKCNYCKKYV